MRPDRIIVGEVRGSESLDMLQAMNTGHDGSLSTVHANTPRDALARIESMVLMAGVDFPLRAVRQQVSRALDLVIQIERFSSGSRRVTCVTEVQRMEGDTITLQDIFEFETSADPAMDGGSLKYSGLRPQSNKFDYHNTPLPEWMTAHEFGGGQGPATLTLRPEVRPSPAEVRRSFR